MDYNTLLIYACLSLLYIYTIHSYMKNFLGSPKSSCLVWYKITIYLFWGISTFSVWLFNETALNTVISVVFIFVIPFFYRSKIRDKVIASFTMYLFIIASEVCMTLAATSFLVISANELKKNADKFLLSIALSKILLLFLTRLFYSLIKQIRIKRAFKFQVDNTAQFAMLTIPLVNIFIIFIIFSVAQEASSWVWVTAIVSFLLLNNFLFFYLYDIGMNNSESKHQLNLLERQIDTYEQNYLEIESTQKKMATIIHDFENRLISLSAIAKNNGELESEIDKIIGTVRLYKSLVYTGNAFVDVIINHKAFYAAQYKIKLLTQIDIATDFVIDTKEFSVLLGNALDNAIEACRQLEVEERKIQILMLQEGKNLCLIIENPYKGLIEYDESKTPISTKTDINMHGYGLKSIRYIAEQILNGVVFIGAENEKFILRIMFFDVFQAEPAKTQNAKTVLLESM